MWLLLVIVFSAVISRERQTQEIAADVRAALAHSGYSLKAAAADMQIDRSQLRRELDGIGHLSMARLSSLSIGFHQWFAVMRAQRVGLPMEIQTGRTLRRSMLKLSLRETQAEEKAS